MSVINQFKELIEIQLKTYNLPPNRLNYILGIKDDAKKIKLLQEYTVYLDDEHMSDDQLKTKEEIIENKPISRAEKNKRFNDVVDCDWWDIKTRECIFEKLCNDTCEVKQGLNVLEEEVMQEYKERICETK